VAILQDADDDYDDDDDDEDGVTEEQDRMLIQKFKNEHGREPTEEEVSAGGGVESAQRNIV
jgi:hypothetical protein